ncbi:sulfur carrier protein ThiS [Candidatus Venteria ishoeyi]|uniref:Sulfur carrier protein ThiS n=1 Tax=Candidatus Venteria ishoeyi TaxID=1899563 RepID=A0A1H6F7G0_9GAMM|nr:sulfur carrier protein ThiS [Candidatus Venteria ishoeyi]SEH06070.1 Sulfur carrier protein ThiS [Candidatus Venteria ishoeyi]
MIEIQVNGESRQIPETYNVSELLAALAMEGQRIAVELNQDIVPRSQFAETRFSAGDQVEIVRAIGGG